MTEPTERATTERRNAQLPGDTNRITTPDTHKEVCGSGSCVVPHTRETDYLNADEHHAITLAAELWNQLCRTIPDGPTRDADLRELIHHVHAIQHAVMANPAARAYPHSYRLLGGTL